MKRVIAAFLVSLIGCTSALAVPVVSCRLTYDTTYAQDTWEEVGDRTAYLTTLNAPGYDSNWVHKIDFSFRVEGLLPAEDVAEVWTSFRWSEGITIATRYDVPWDPYNVFVECYDPRLPSRKYTKSLYVTNFDADTYNNDLYNVAGTIDPDVAWIAQPGEGDWLQMGSIYVKWDNTSLANVTADRGNFSTWKDNENGSSRTVGLYYDICPPYTLSFGVPEPTSLSIVIGGLILFMRRRASGG